MNDSESRPDEFEGRFSSTRDWREIVAWVGDLPPMPHVAARAIGMVEDPSTTAGELTDLLSSDTALAARVLKIANSAMFSRQREITTLSQAIMIIGFKALKGIIVAATLRQINKRFGRLEKMLWEHSMSTAMCATLISKTLRKSFVEEIFLLGLLHSLGQIVLIAQKETSADYKNVLKMIEEVNQSYSTCEQEVYGFSHPLIGALVAKKWNFSSNTCQVILHYLDDLDGNMPETDLEEKTVIVKLADLISHAAQIGSPTGYPEQAELIKEVALHIGFQADGIEETLENLITKTQEQFAQEGSIYS